MPDKTEVNETTNDRATASSGATGPVNDEKLNPDDSSPAAAHPGLDDASTEGPSDLRNEGPLIKKANVVLPDGDEDESSEGGPLKLTDEEVLGDH